MDKKWHRNYYLNHKEKWTTYDRKYREKNKEIISKKLKSYYELNRIPKYHLKLYGISFNDYKIMLDKQKGVCAICGGIYKNRLAVDHNHITKTVRGLLCVRCNMGLGMFKDDIELLIKAIKYLK